jgi:hypothetical protein
MAKDPSPQHEIRIAIRFDTTNVPGEPKNRLRRIANDFAKSKLSREFDSDSDFSTGPPILISRLASESGCYVTLISAGRFFKWTRSQYNGGMLLTTSYKRRKLFAPLILLITLTYSIGGLPNVG